MIFIVLLTAWKGEGKGSIINIAIQIIKMFLMMEKELVLSKATLNNISYQSKVVFQGHVFHSISKLCVVNTVQTFK